MVTLVGFWERAWVAPMVEAALWEFVCREYETGWVMSPVSGIDHSSLVEVRDVEKYIQGCRARQEIVFVEEHAQTSLEDFEHPSEAVYVTGRTSFSPAKVYKQPQDRSVRIPTPRNLGMMWGHQAALLVLADRFRKDV